MNIKDAKSIPLDEFLEKQGYTGRLKAGRLWYAIRRETTPSFVLSRDRFAWYDHGIGQGGNIIQWPIEYRNVRDVKEALGYIENVMGTGYVFQPNNVEFKKMEPELPGYKLISLSDFEPYKCRELTPFAKYLVSRGLNLERSAMYIQELSFHHKDDLKKKLHHGFGMPNASEGIEARSTLSGIGFKPVTVGQKDVSIIQARDTTHGTDDWHTKTWRAFYSMMDFLTYISTQDEKPGTCNFLVIHGDGLNHKAAEYLNELPAGYMVHYPHIDPNGNGQRAMFELMGESRDWRHVEISHEYEGFKDLNEKHMYDLGLDYRPAAGYGLG